MPQITLLMISQGFKLCFIGIQRWCLYPPQFFGDIFWSSFFPFPLLFLSLLWFVCLFSCWDVVFLYILDKLWMLNLPASTFQCWHYRYVPPTHHTLREFLFSLAVSYVKHRYNFSKSSTVIWIQRLEL